LREILALPREERARYNPYSRKSDFHAMRYEVCRKATRMPYQVIDGEAAAMLITKGDAWPPDDWSPYADIHPYHWALATKCR